MPLPLLDRASFARLTDSLPLSDYFNPSKNTNFYERSPHEGTSRNLCKYGNIRAVAQSLATPEALEDIMKSCQQQYANNQNNFFANTIFKRVYNFLPDDKKYLIFGVCVTHHSNPGGSRKIYRVYSISPMIQNSYNDWASQTNYFEFSATLNNSNGETFLNEQQETTFQQGLETTQLFNNSHSHWDATAEQLFYGNEGNSPRIPTLVYRFITNQKIYFPDNDQSGVLFDWLRPSDITTYINDGYNFVFTFSHSNRVKFRTRPKPGDRRALSRIMPYSTNVLDHLPYTIKGPKEPNATLYGIELEANGDYTPTQVIEAQKDLFFILKQDSSIYGSRSNSYEMVTVPATMKAHKRLWAEFFEKVDYNRFDTTKATGNGMHVHIDRKTFSKGGHLNKLVWFITNPANFDFMLAVSERPTQANFREWAQVPNHLCHNTKLRAASMAEHSNGGLRGAVHTRKSATVEIRMFKGIVSYATIVKNIEFVDSAIEYTRDVTLSQVSLRGYLSWLSATPNNRYQMLKTFLVEAKAPEYLVGAELTEYLWKTEREHEVEFKLNKAPFKITNAHITYLNKKRRKRTFILKDGVVICTQKNGGLLAKLDKSVQQRQVRGAASFVTTEFAA